MNERKELELFEEKLPKMILPLIEDYLLDQVYNNVFEDFIAGNFTCWDKPEDQRNIYMYCNAYKNLHGTDWIDFEYGFIVEAEENILKKIQDFISTQPNFYNQLLFTDEKDYKLKFESYSTVEKLTEIYVYEPSFLKTRKTKNLNEVFFYLNELIKSKEGITI